MRRDAFFLSLGGGRRFCVRYAPDGDASVGRALVYVHPLAEEMNKSRRMAALQARALADRGCAVLQVDLLGCGDSDGEFADASWSSWVDDVVRAHAWLRSESGCVPALWGLRAGCLLACEAARALDSATNLLFWQPALSGSQSLQQFLRVKAVASAFGDAQGERTGTRQLSQRLVGGETVEVGGYDISPYLARGLAASRLSPPSTATRVAWLEVTSVEPPSLPPAAQAAIDTWRGAGHAVDARAIGGEPFWQTQEIAECAPLIDATIAALAAWPR